MEGRLWGGPSQGADMGMAMHLDRGRLPVSMMVGHVFMLTAEAASLERRVFMRVCVVRMQAALLTWDQYREKGTA